MEKNLNELYEAKESYKKEVKTLEGILSYYKDKKETRIHNKIIISIYTIALSAVAATSSILAVHTSTIAVGVGCLIGSLVAYAGGLSIIINNIKLGKQLTKERYKREYDLDVDELYIKEQYLNGLGISKRNNEIMLKKTEDKIKELTSSKDNTTSFTKISPMTHTEELTNNNVRTLSKNK